MSGRFLLEWSAWGSWHDTGAEGEYRTCSQVGFCQLLGSLLLGVGERGAVALRHLSFILSPGLAFSHRCPFALGSLTSLCDTTSSWDTTPPCDIITTL